MFSLFSTDTADKRHEDIVWVSFITLEINLDVCVCVILAASNIK